MRIAVDLDDTLSFVDRITRPSAYIERTGLDFKVVDPDAHTLVDVFDWDLPDVLEFVREGGITVFTDAEARRGAREALEALRAAGHEVVILTAREKDWFVNPEMVSRDWLEKRHIPYDEIVAEIPHGEKGKYCIEHGISVLIDDNFDTCLKAQELGVHAVLAVGRNNIARAREIHYGGANWKQIYAAVAHILTILP